MEEENAAPTDNKQANCIYCLYPVKKNNSKYVPYIDMYDQVARYLPIHIKCIEQTLIMDPIDYAQIVREIKQMQ